MTIRRSTRRKSEVATVRARRSTEVAFADPEEAKLWSHVSFATWTQVQDREAVHLTCAGSNSCFTGFQSLAEALVWRERSGLGPAWHAVDLRRPVAARRRAA